MEKDASAAWSTGVLTLGEWTTPTPSSAPPRTPELPQQLADEPEPASIPSASPMAWSDALARCKRLDTETWKNATSMARNRHPSELPESWRRAGASGDGDSMHDGKGNAYVSAQAMLPDA